MSCKIRLEEISAEEIEQDKVLLIDRISFDEGKIFAGDRAAAKMSQLRAKPGDILVSKIRARNGSIGIVPEGRDIAISSNYRALIPNQNSADSAFLWLALRSPFCRSQFLAETPGSSKGQISEERLLEIRVPFPDLTEQRKIAALWRQRQNEIAQAEAKIAAGEESQTAATLAKTGIQVNDSPMRPHVFAVHSSETNRWGVRFNRHRWNLDNLMQSDEFSCFPLSEVAFINPASPERIAPNDSVTFVPMESVSGKSGEIVAPQIRPCREVAKGYTRFAEGDIIWAKITPCMQNGKCAVARNLKNGVGFGSTEFHVIRPHNPKSLLPEYVWLLLRLPKLREAAKRYFIGSAGQQRVPEEFLRGLRLPIPPMKEQKSIVRAVEESHREIADERENLQKLRRDSQVEINQIIIGAHKAN